MTRKDEFKSRALRIAAQNTPYHLYPLADEIMKALIQVEREVWERVAERCIRSAMCEADLPPDDRIGDGSIATFHEILDWARQQKEVW